MKLIETHKNCTKCGEANLITSYHWRKKGVARHDVCPSCRNAKSGRDRASEKDQMICQYTSMAWN